MSGDRHSGQFDTTWSMWLFLTVFVLLIFQCRGVSLWQGRAQPCVEAAP